MTIYLMDLKIVRGSKGVVTVEIIQGHQAALVEHLRRLIMALVVSVAWPQEVIILRILEV